MQPADMAHNPFTLFEDLYENHSRLKSLESLRDKDTEAKKAKKHDENLEGIFGKEQVEQAFHERTKKVSDIAQSQWDTFRTDLPGIEGSFQVSEQAFLHSIQKSVLYLCKSGTPIDWEANAEGMIQGLKLQLETCRQIGELSAQLGGSPMGLPPALSRLIEQEIIGHQDQFSSTFFTCAKMQIEGFKQNFLNALQLAQTQQKCVINMETPLQYHSIDCLGSYDYLRNSMEKFKNPASTAETGPANENSKSIENPEIKAHLVKFAQSFKKVKEIGMANSLKVTQYGIENNKMAVEILGIILRTPQLKELIMKKVEEYKASESFRAMASDQVSANMALNQFILSMSASLLNAIAEAQDAEEANTQEPKEQPQTSRLKAEEVEETKKLDPQDQPKSSHNEP